MTNETTEHPAVPSSRRVAGGELVLFAPPATERHSRRKPAGVSTLPVPRQAPIKEIEREALEMHELDDAILRIAKRLDTPGSRLRFMLLAGAFMAFLPFAVHYVLWLVGWPV